MLCHIWLQEMDKAGLKRENAIRNYLWIVGLKTDIFATSYPWVSAMAALFLTL